MPGFPRKRRPAGNPIVVDNELRYTFHWNEKLHLQKDFQRIFASGRKLAHPAISIYIYVRSDGPAVRRLGLITSRKLGTAVQRNRVKRRLREIFRLHKHLLKPGSDILFIPRVGAADLNYAQLKSIVLSLWQRAGVIAEDTGGSP
ncbi:MAG: ribonuclease P protein component [Endomicrobiales bacterium]